MKYWATLIVNLHLCGQYSESALFYINKKSNDFFLSATCLFYLHIIANSHFEGIIFSIISAEVIVIDAQNLHYLIIFVYGYIWSPWWCSSQRFFCNIFLEM